MEQGVLPQGRSLPGDRLLYAVNDRSGRTSSSMGLVQGGRPGGPGLATRTRSQAAGRRAVSGAERTWSPRSPRAPGRVPGRGPPAGAGHHDPGRHGRARSPRRIGFDDVIATRYEVADGRYTGPPLGRVRLGHWASSQAVRAWADESGIDLADCHACSDSVFDVPLLAERRPARTPSTPTASLTLVATARRWPVEHWDRPPGVPSLVGLEPYHLLRPFLRPELLPLRPLRHRRASSTCRPRARSCWPPTTAATSTWPPWRSWPRLGRPVRFLAKSEIFDAPGRRADRPGHRRHPGRPGQRLGRAAARGRGGARGRARW